ncbi:unnamed protein product [Dicrocoelium dendriticum]|nr:unnamed protein product [Dicrocoelium dendriticum]
MRTGTWSLKCALETLYEKPCYHMAEIFFKRRKAHIKSWLDILKRTDSSEVEVTKATFDSLYDGFGAAVDYPTCLFYKHLMEFYPKAKVILTVREPDEWVASCRATTLSRNLMRPSTLGEELLYWYRGINGIANLHLALFRRTFGPNFSEMSDEELKEVYTRWNADVVNTVPPERLLVFRYQDGWTPLCRFLNFPVPPKSCPFPHLNKREIFAKNMQATFDQASFIQGLIYAVIVAGALFAYLWYSTFHE